MIETPDPDILEDVNDVTVEELPRLVPVERHRNPPAVDDIPAAVSESLTAIDGFGALEPGAEVAITAGSRGIHDIVPVLQATVEQLQERELSPFVFPAMGSHGGATAKGQRETLATLGITEESLGCEIRSSMDVDVVGEDSDGRPVFASNDALAADAVLLVNRIKLHTDFKGEIESGLCKMAVIGVGKQRGANSAHNAALETSFRDVIPDRTEVLVEETPIIGGVALLENANERVAELEGVPADELLDRESELLDRSEELFPKLPVDDLDLLILDEIGKNVSGTGMDTNVVGRMLIHGEPELPSPEITRIYVRSLTEKTHGNANGIGLADFAHQRVCEQINTTDTYVNSITGGQPERGRLPVVVPRDLTALMVTYSTTSVVEPSDLRLAYVENTLEPDHLLVSEAVADELADRDDITVGEPRPMEFVDGDFAPETEL